MGKLKEALYRGSFSPSKLPASERNAPKLTLVPNSGESAPQIKTEDVSVSKLDKGSRIVVEGVIKVMASKTHAGGTMMRLNYEGGYVQVDSDGDFPVPAE